MAFSVTERLMAIQRALDLKDDGILGPATLTAIERVVAKRRDERAHQGFSLITSLRGLGQLISFEISSPQFYYRNLKKPVWPGGKSGVTIGIGYDLGYHRASQIERDWKGQLPDRDVERLVGVAGLRGEDAKRSLRRLRNVIIPFEDAQRVFYESSLPKFAKDTRRIYPGVERLPADAQAMLLSLVYNRGTALSGSRRREMKAIKGHVRRKRLGRIADEMREMKRLWDKNVLPGLHKRRDAEAELVLNAERGYVWSELIYL